MGNKNKGKKFKDNMTSVSKQIRGSSKNWNQNYHMTQQVSFRYLSKETKTLTQKDIWTPIFIVALFTITKIWNIMEKVKEFQKNIYFCFIDYVKAFIYVDHNKLWKILKEMRIPDHLTCLLKICMQVKKQQLELEMEE